MNLTLIITILVAHFIADFVMQTDEMAKGKSHSNRWLTQHVLVYTAVLATPVGFSFTFTGTYPAFVFFILWLMVNGLAHFVTDYFTSRWSSSLWKQGRTHDFFVVIGLDQTIHFITLFITAKWLLQG